MPPTEPSTRSLPPALLVLLLLLFAGRAGFALWENKHPAQVYERVEWLDPVAAAEASAMHRRPILYDFTADWCGPCNRLKAEVFADRAQGAMIAVMFVPARVLDRRQEDGSNPALVDSLQRRFAVEGFPTLVAVTPDGREVGRVVGYPGARVIMDSLQTFSRRARLAAMPMASPGLGTP
jgi:thiol:disulfide interchange protein